MDADGWKRIMTSNSFGESSTDLCKAFAEVIKKTFCLSLQPLLELGSKSTFLSSGLWMLPKQCDTIC